MEDRKTGIAYLILAHNDEDHLQKLVDSLNSSNVHFYIHIDKKSRLAETVKTRFSQYLNVQVYSEYKVYWMGFNMVNATLLLLKKAFSSNVPHRYYVLLSGQDFPIKNQLYINTFFENASNDFISINKFSSLNIELFKKIHTHHYLDFPYWNPRNKQKKPLLVKLYYGLQNKLFPKLYRRNFYKNYEPYFGSQWFALTYQTVRYILEYLQSAPQYISFMKYTEGPDEFFFQTLIGNSICHNNVIKSESEFMSLANGDSIHLPKGSLTFMDWSEHLKIKPATLNENYYEEIVNSSFLFARKFSSPESDKLIKKIEASIL